jgi:hypothetical protein
MLTATDCCARRLLAIQPDFVNQQCEIEERIQQFPGNEGHYQAMYYPKFHCELNHIEYFWCHSKWYARENCDYTIDGLRKTVGQSRDSPPHSPRAVPYILPYMCHNATTPQLTTQETCYSYIGVR